MSIAGISAASASRAQVGEFDTKPTDWAPEISSPEAAKTAIVCKDGKAAITARAQSGDRMKNRHLRRNDPAGGGSSDRKKKPGSSETRAFLREAQESLFL